MKSKPSASSTVWAVLVVTAILAGVGLYVAADDLRTEHERQQDALNETALEELVREAVNEERTERGLSELEPDQQLTTIARNHSQDMAQREYYGHEDPDGVGPGDRVLGAVENCTTVGENIASTWYREQFRTDGGVDRHDSVAEVADGLADQWLNSPDHRENMLDPRWQETGVGITTTDEGEVIATQIFCN